MQADKRTLISKFELGIPIRDMRLLDSTLVTSSRGYIAVRENAIVFAIECGSPALGRRSASRHRWIGSHCPLLVLPPP